MQNLLEQLKTTLQSDDRLVIDDALVKNKIVELALAMDEALLTLLLSNKAIKKQFFKDIGGVLIFDKVAFQRFVSNKQFLPDSYTAFKNKIGLTANGEYLTESREVVLAWPYKDCTLEGGQTKGDQKRKEIFWNETLAPDEIDRLLDPKVLTNFKRYDKDGEHEVEGVDLDDNLIIKGNNLLALHCLKKQYAGKVKLIYIDPPYNTGSDSFGYNDSFNHSTWLTFMRNRLEVARELLRSDGVIFVQCDDNEQAYLKVLMDELFGRDNFICSLVWKGRGGRQDSKFIAEIHETIILFSKNTNNLYIRKKIVKDESSYQFHDNERMRNYKLQLVRKWGSNSKKEDRPNLFYGVLFEGKEIFPIHPDGNDGCWRWSKKKLEKAIEDKLIIKQEKKGNIELYEKIFESNGSKEITYNSWIEDSFSGKGATHIKELFGENLFDYSKPEELIKYILDISTTENDIVLDYHLGSGTTISTAHKMGRRYIGIEQMDYIHDVTCERLKKVIAGEQGGISKAVNWQDGGSFTYCELAQHNAKIIDKIEQASTTKALIALWHEIENTDFISYKIKPKTINQNIHEFAALSIKEQNQFLIAVLDKNQLYVNYSEMEDTDYQISDVDKKLNKQFYGD